MSVPRRGNFGRLLVTRRGNFGRLLVTRRGDTRDRATHRRRSREQRLQPFLAAFVALSVVGLGIVLFDHFGPAAAGSTWRDPLGYAAVESPGPSTVATGLATLPATSAPTSTPASTPPTPKPARVVTSLHVKFPKVGPETFHYATTTGPVLGRSGSIRRFRVAMESNIKVVTTAAFVAKIDATLGDARSWVGGGQYRLQQVPASSPAQFTIFLVTETTSSRMCAPLYTGGYTSCRQGSHVVLNLDRWMTSVPGYVQAKVPLVTYRTYMINHEVGHALGHSHELCPGPGRPAPVMEQQTLGLHGCTANPWPYILGKAYNGPLGQY